VPAETVWTEERMRLAMDAVMEKFEEEMKSPVVNMITGDMIALMLIQVQKLKIEMETALLQMDQVLRANQLNFAAFATIPAWTLTVLAGGFFRSLLWRPHHRRARMRWRMRLLLADTERALIACGEGGLEEARPLQMGLLLYSLNALYVSGVHYQSVIGKAEWRYLRRDVLELAAPHLSYDTKLATISRMGRLYTCFSRLD